MRPGDVISYLEMCQVERVNLQRGMNYRLHGGRSVFLMSIRSGAPYADQVSEAGKVLIYEGHDAPRETGGPEPKTLDQPLRTSSGALTQNGLFFEAAGSFKRSKRDPELVRVYEKIRSGIWVYNGVFKLVDARKERSEGRYVYKFRLEIVDSEERSEAEVPLKLEHERLIPSAVKLAVWKRDRGRCVQCGSVDNLHFDHIIPFSKGGSSLVADNVQLLCARHNLAKHDRIQ